jgi:EpsD family peptidyl-prolyl cis-trans isomerase
MPRISLLTSALVTAAVLTLAACGGDGGGGEEKKATQVAAKVNSEEVTVHQINGALPKMNNPTEAQVQAARKQVLERLIDQQLFIQKAMEAKLDRDPQVMTAIENSRREILSRAYVERVMGNAAKPDPAEVKKFFDAHPELFSERRVYRLQEVALQVAGPELEALKQALPPMKTLQEVVAYAKEKNIRATANSSVRAAEQLPMEFAARISKLKDGEIVAVPGPGGLAIVQIVASQSQPLSEQQGTPFIEQFLQNKARMELARSELKTLRGGAKVEYVGDFAKDPAASDSLAPAAGDMPAAPAAPSAPAEGGAAQDSLEKGLQGLSK